MTADRRPCRRHVAIACRPSGCCRSSCDRGRGAPSHRTSGARRHLSAATAPDWPPEPVRDGPRVRGPTVGLAEPGRYHRAGDRRRSSRRPRPLAGRLRRCARGCRAHSPRSAAACSPCSRATGSTRRPGRRSRTRCSPLTSASHRPRSWSSGCGAGSGSRARPATRRRTLLREELVALVDPTLDRSLRSSRARASPASCMVVGVNGVGKTTTVGKIARVLVADGQGRAAGSGGHLPRRRRRPAADLG